MLPWPLMAALVLAFGIGDLSGRAPLESARLWHRIGLWGACFAGFTVLSMIAGLLAAQWVRHGGASRSLRRLAAWTDRGLELLALGLFAWGVLGLEWPRIVAWNLAGRSTILLDDLLTVAPFLAELLVVWSASYPLDRLLAPSARPISFGRYLGVRIRQTAGVLLPLILIYGLGQDLLRRFIPEYRENPTVQLGMLAVVAGGILLASPVFVRLSCPTRRLEDGPLRERLDRLARRFHFRCSDILVWDTGGSLVNAGITGALPFFRYVLLSDGLIERLGAPEIEAVFGHEIGHVKHRHLVFFGLFFVGSVGLLSLFDLGLQAAVGWLPEPLVGGGGASLGEIVQWGLALAILATYFLVVFGYLSRWFERQADLFGCRVVSCGRGDCPPHYDPNALASEAAAPGSICVGGIRIFARALTDVAVHNGLSLHAPSWRHGSIARRIAFVETLEGHPEAVRRFEDRIVRLRIAVVALLGLATLLSLWLHEGATRIL
jgi:STE24 endopeptidase